MNAAWQQGISMNRLFQQLFGRGSQTVRLQKPRRALKLQVEALEDRQLMASNLLATTISVVIHFPPLDPTAVWIDQNIHDTGLHNLLRQDESDHVLTRNEM